MILMIININNQLTIKYFLFILPTSCACTPKSLFVYHNIKTIQPAYKSDRHLAQSNST